MIAALIVYCLAVSTLLGIAAVAAEHVVRLARRPARFVWIVTMGAAIAFSAARFKSGLATPAPIVAPPAAAVSIATAGDIESPATHAVVASPASPASSQFAPLRIVRALQSRASALRILVAEGAPVTTLDRPLLVGWAVLSILALAVIGLSARRLTKPSVPWSATIVDGVPVLVSHDLGPAVIGLFRYRIVLPAWILDLAPMERDLVLAHEREHAAAGDPWLLFVSMVLVALAPWNVALWWMARRLRFAVELDCDARVLRARPNPAAYGALLLDVSERSLGGAMPVVAMAESGSLIARRISAMTNRAPRFAWLRSACAASLAALLVAAACVAPHPMRIAVVPRSALRVELESATLHVAPPMVHKPAARSRVIAAPWPVADKPALDSVTSVELSPPDSIFDRLFAGIALTAEQEAKARDILAVLERRQQAQDAVAAAQAALSQAKTAELLTERNAALRSLLTTDADRATFDARAARNPGTVVRPNAPTWMVPITRFRRIDSVGGIARVVWFTINRLDTLDSTRRMYAPALVRYVVAVQDAMFRGLFDGISLTSDQESAARATMTKTQQDIAAARPPRREVLIHVEEATGRVLIRAPNDSALVAVVSNEADRAKLLGRITTMR